MAIINFTIHTKLINKSYLDIKINFIEVMKTWVLTVSFCMFENFHNKKQVKKKFSQWDL